MFVCSAFNQVLSKSVVVNFTAHTEFQNIIFYVSK